MKKIKSTPKRIFLIKNVFWKLYHVSKNEGTVLRVAHIQNISQNEKGKSGVSFGSLIQNCKNKRFPLKR